MVDNDQGFPKRWTFYISKEGKLLEIDKMVRPDDHGAQIAKKLAELGIDKAD